MLQCSLFILVLLCTLVSWHAPSVGHASEDQPRTTLVGVPADVLEDYKLFMGNRLLSDITQYDGPHSRRDVVEVILFQQALAIGGYNNKILFNPIPTDLRLQTELQDANIAAIATSTWHYAVSNKMQHHLISDPLIMNGEFEAGLYTAIGNTKARKANSADTVKQLTAVSNRHWIPDWKTLTALKLKTLHHVQSWTGMVRMVANQRADFLLAPFQQTKDMDLVVKDMTLVPIHGIKIGLTGSRHFAVSNTHIEGQTLYKALQIGIKELRKCGTIRKAYRESGFFNEQTHDWLLIKEQ